jgi:hypothetical protein
MPYALLFFATAQRLLLRQEGIAPLSAAVCGLLLALLRVEGIAWALLLGVLAWISRRHDLSRQRRTLLYFALLLAPYAIYWLIRHDYFEAAYAHTVSAKVSLGLSSLKAGLRYVAVYVLTFLTPFSLLLTAWPALRGSWKPGPPVLFVAVAVFAYATVVGGDFMTMGRLLLPAVPLLSLLWAHALASWSQRPTTLVAGTLASLVLLVIGLLPGFNIHLISNDVRSQFHFRLNKRFFRTEHTQWQEMRNTVEARRITGQALHQHTDPAATLVCGVIGVVGYYSERFIYDRYGLVTPPPVTRDRSLKRSPGHRRAVPRNAFLPDQPTYMFAAVYADLRKLRRQVEDFRKGNLRKHYVPELVLLPESGKLGETRYLFLYRRLQDDENPKQAWGELDARLAQL